MSNVLTIGLGLLAQSTVTLSLGLAAARLLRRRGPALCAFVLQLTLASVALGCILSVCLAGRVQPVWQIRMAPTLPSPMPQQPRRGMGEGNKLSDAPVVKTVRLDASTSPVYPNNRDTGEVATLGIPKAILPSLPHILTTLWAAGAGLLLLWLVACQWHLVTLRRHATTITDGQAFAMLAQLSAAQKVRAPRLFVSPVVQSPFLAGILRPAIFLPATWNTDYDDTALHVILAHELAHHTRRDCAWTLLLRLTTALLWPQPLLWLLGRQLEQAAEEACDLLALTPDCPPRRYADTLLTLAERCLCSPMERTVGAGVIPARSSVGRRIQQLLQAKALSPITARLRLLLGILVGAAALTAAVVFVMPRTVPGFSWAKAQGWDVQPIRVVRLEPHWLRTFEPIPPNLSPQDVAIIRMCWLNNYPPSAASTVAQRHVFGQIAARYPQAFYPKHCLAIWYENHHQMALYQYWEQQALLQAPQVLAGRIECADGRPVTNAAYLIQLSTFEPGHLQPPQTVAYDRLTTTDQEGCYYIPVFKGIYAIASSPGLRLGEVTDAQGKLLNIFVTGGDTSDWLKSVTSGRMTLGMVAASRAGVLPKIIARPGIQFVTPIQPVSDGPDHPVLLHGDVLDFVWKPVPGAV